MKLSKEMKVKTFEVESDYYKGFYVDVVEVNGVYWAYLWHKQRLDKMLLFGRSADSISEKHFVEQISQDLFWTRFMADYMEEYHYKKLDCVTEG